ncbi:hypothetical protein HOLleu_14089 [Holothuria leucospilota]|uniref:Uncharacterized protein n=1 Tax=Holothuria leucospilota TaxID=206669 RepID=A0A9Q1HBF8_HOLLE|nr:hypothetical protein HOLleu_14089 [Holothuria leucospilota]
MVPRTNSTVFMKCLSFVDDAEVWMEPYCACYINGTLRNPDWGKGNPVMDRIRAEVKEVEKKEEYAALKKLEIEKANKYKNVWPQETFKYEIKFSSLFYLIIASARYA